MRLQALRHKRLRAFWQGARPYRQTRKCFARACVPGALRSSVPPPRSGPAVASSDTIRRPQRMLQFGEDRPCPGAAADVRRGLAHQWHVKEAHRRHGGRIFAQRHVGFTSRCCEEKNVNPESGTESTNEKIPATPSTGPTERRHQMNRSTRLKAILAIVGVSTAGACATTGDQRGRAPDAQSAGQAQSQSTTGRTPSETETERFFRLQDEASRYAR